MPTDQQFTVQQYMSSDVVSIETTATIRQAINLMNERNINSLVVVDAQRRVVGMLSSIDVIAYVVPDYLEADKHLASFEAGEVFATRIRTIGDQPVTASMSASVTTIQPTHTLIEAATLLSEHRINQLPVVDGQEHLIGYIGRSNIKKAIGDVFDSLP